MVRAETSLANPIAMTRKRSSPGSADVSVHSARSATGHSARSATARADTDRAEGVYRDIHAAIVERRLPPGAHLPEAHLAEVFGVSRTLVRQALQHLVHDHLAVQEPNRGVRVASPTVDEVRQLYEVRRILECTLLSEKAPGLTRARLAALRRTVADEAAANAAGDTVRAMQLADAFHLELAAAIGNPVLVDILQELIARGSVAIALYEQPGRASCRCHEHRRIISHLAGGDPAKAAAEMRTHLCAIEESLVHARAPAGPLHLGRIFARSSKDSV